MFRKLENQEKKRTQEKGVISSQNFSSLFSTTHPQWISGNFQVTTIMMVPKTELRWCHFKDKVEPFGVWQKSISRVKHFPMLLYGSSPKVTFFPLQILGANGHLKFISFHKSLDRIFFFFPLKLLMFDTFW